MIAILITNINSLRDPLVRRPERTNGRTSGSSASAPPRSAAPARRRLPLFIKPSKRGSSRTHLSKQDFEALPGGVCSLLYISAHSFLLSVSLWIFFVVYAVALSLVFFLFFFLLGLVAFQDWEDHKFALKRVRIAGLSFVCSCRIRGARRDLTKQGR